MHEKELKLWIAKNKYKLPLSYHFDLVFKGQSSNRDDLKEKGLKMSDNKKVNARFYKSITRF